MPQLAIWQYSDRAPSKYCHNVCYEKKLEWCDYPTVKKLMICLFMRTDGHLATVWSAVLVQSIAR